MTLFRVVETPGRQLVDKGVANKGSAVMLRLNVTAKPTMILLLELQMHEVCAEATSHGTAIRRVARLVWIIVCVCI